MESQVLVSLFFLSPAWMLGLSILYLAWKRAPISHVTGVFDPRSAWMNGIIVFSQLFLVSILIDHGSTLAGINDTQNVELFAQSLQNKGLVGGFTLLVSAAIEEVFFRGTLYTAFGSIPSILLFGLFHAGYFSIIEVSAALVAGAILVHARKTYGSIFPGIVGHALYNLAIIFILR